MPRPFGYSNARCTLQFLIKTMKIENKISCNRCGLKEKTININRPMRRIWTHLLYDIFERNISFEYYYCDGSRSGENRITNIHEKY